MIKDKIDSTEELARENQQLKKQVGQATIMLKALETKFIELQVSL